jgi:hypothetical protein
MNLMNYRAASGAVSRIATPKNNAASRGVFIIPRRRDNDDFGPLRFSIQIPQAGFLVHRGFTIKKKGVYPTVSPEGCFRQGYIDPFASKK